ncbi:MAG TPA: hypothetical protein VFP14_09940 [Novosphingobium sp.]|nr:hypothetical protein [Novosphingobium sp.]
MSLAPTDERNLVEPLFSGLLTRPPWQQFLSRLVARTRAERAGIMIRGPGGARLDSWQEAFSTARDRPRSEGSDWTPLPTGLRPLRVYTHADLIELGVGDDTADSAATAGYGRYMRVPGEPGWDAWIVLTQTSRDFTAGDSALVSDLAPYLATAFALIRELDGLLRRAAMAEEALSALGVSQALLDQDRRIAVAGSGQVAAIGVRPGATLQLPGARGADLAQAVTQLGTGSRTQVLVGDTVQPKRDILLRPAPAAGAAIALPKAVLALTRAEPPAPASAVAEMLAQQHGLSAREAELAVALAWGEELVPAGVRLGLTPETTRNYSKRIYAKTGARGQADLVRMVLTGLAPFAS